MVLGHAGDAVMLGTENLSVNDLANECVVLENANDAPAGWTIIRSLLLANAPTVVSILMSGHPNVYRRYRGVDPFGHTQPIL